MCSSSSKNVVHVTTVHPLYDNRIFFKQCCSLTRNGFDVTLIATHDSETVVNGVKIKPLKKRKGLIGRSVRLFQAFSYLKKMDNKLVHLHDPELLVLKPFLKILGKVVIYDAHEHFSEQITIKTQIPKYLRSILKVCASVYERIFIGRGPVIFAETSYKDSYRYVKEYGFALNLPELHRFEAFRTEKRQDVFLIGYIGGVTKARGCLKVLKSIVKLKNKTNKKLGFVCIGKFESALLETEMKALGAQLDHYYAPGFLPFTDGIRYIAECQVGVAVLDRTPNYERSYPTKIFEYMALGLPFIVSNFPINMQVVEENQCGIAVAPESTEALEKALEDIILKEDVRSMMANNALMNYRKYDWDTQLQIIMSCYLKWYN